MSRDTFIILCNELKPHLERRKTKFRNPVSVEVRVAVTIWRLGTNVEFRTIAELFGLGRSTVGEIVLDTCDAITSHLFPRYVYVPQNDRLKEVIDGFEHRWGFPQTVGAIDGSHIPILKPKDSASDYYNRKGFYSIIMQAVVEFRGLFIDINIGWPGKVHDARVLVNSTFFRKGNSGNLFPRWSRTMSGVNVPLLVLGDPAYPLLPWLMKPFMENPNTTPGQRNFNYRLSRARMVVENAFGRLKGRWRCLMKRIDSHTVNVPNIVASCVVLHNMCEIYGDYCLEEWVLHEVNRSRLDNTSNSSTPCSTTCTASAIRDAIKNYVE